MNRRSFLAATSTLAATASLGPISQAKFAEEDVSVNSFTLDYAPHFGMFSNSGSKSLIGQLEFAAAQGFRSWEDNGMSSRSEAIQTEIASNMKKLKMRMGVVSAVRGVWSKVSIASGREKDSELFLSAIRKIIPVAQRLKSKWVTVVPGMQAHNLPMDFQMANCADTLKKACQILEPYGITMVLEPLNHFVDHPETFLVGSPQAYLLCKTVGHPSCKILFDIYHQQITEGNVINNIDRCWDEIGYFQCGDNPGRKEPGTGEINYKNIFAHIHKKEWKGVIGMEHGNSIQGETGEQAVIGAYRAVDPPKVFPKKKKRRSS